MLACTIAVGTLRPSIRPALNCPFIDFNINAELGKFGLHNGGPQDPGLLNEKWEGLALLPVNANKNNNKKKARDRSDEYFLFAVADNDFITDNGFTNFGAFDFAEGLGVEVDHQVLVFKVKLPKGSKPLIG